jgi:hypothetical protein
MRPGRWPDHGFRVLIAPSFADIFHQNAIKNGLLPIVLDEQIIDALFELAGGDEPLEIEVDLQAQRLQPRRRRADRDRDRCLPSPLPDPRAGRHRPDVGARGRDRAYEQRRQREAPWLFGEPLPRVGMMPSSDRAVRSTLRPPTGKPMHLLPWRKIEQEDSDPAWRRHRPRDRRRGREGARLSADDFGLDIETETAWSVVPHTTLRHRRCRSRPSTLAKAADAVLLGAVGGPKWEPLGDCAASGEGLLGPARRAGLFANLRPAILYPQLAEASTLKPEVVSGLDIMIVRELTGGIYFGQPRGVETLESGERRGFNTWSTPSPRSSASAASPSILAMQARQAGLLRGQGQCARVHRAVA